MRCASLSLLFARALAGLYLLAIVDVAASGVRAPVWNFDVVGYVAASLALSQADSTLVHSDTFGSIAEAAPVRAFTALTEGSDYRRALRRTPAALSTQIPFYQCKFGYVAMTALLHRLGMNAARATYLISAVSYVALGVLALVWLRRKVGAVIAVGLSVVFMLLPQIRELAGYSTPDLPAAFFMGLAAFFTLERQRFGPAIVFLVLACTVRPEPSRVRAQADGAPEMPNLRSP